jgi:hypothetical protein
MKRFLTGAPDRNISHYRNPRIAAEFVGYEHPRGAYQLHRSLTFHWFVKNRIHRVFGEAHGILGVATQTINNHAAIRRRFSRDLHYLLYAVAQLKHAGLKFFAMETVGGIGAYDYRLDSSLAKTVGKYGPGRFFQVH